MVTFLNKVFNTDFNALNKPLQSQDIPYFFKINPIEMNSLAI